MRAEESDSELTTGEVVSCGVILGGVIAAIRYHKVVLPLLAVAAIPAAICGACYLAGSYSGRGAGVPENEAR